MPSNSQDGRKDAGCGQRASLVNLSQMLENAVRAMTNAISGRSLDRLLRHFIRPTSSESRLRVLLDGNGSPEYSMTWKIWDMPCGRRVSRLAPSRRRIKECDSSGTLVHWITPQSHDAVGRSDPNRLKRHGTKHGCSNLVDQAALSGWPTPMAGSPKTETYNEAGDTCNGRKTRLLLSGWGTTTTRDWKDGASTLENVAINALLGRQVQLIEGIVDLSEYNLGENSTFYIALMENSEEPLSLNPGFSRWHMGFPKEWDDFAPTVTPSYLKSPLHSSLPPWDREVI